MKVHTIGIFWRSGNLVGQSFQEVPLDIAKVGSAYLLHQLKLNFLWRAQLRLESMAGTGLLTPKEGR